jgi:uncharacterized protein
MKIETIITGKNTLKDKHPSSIFNLQLFLRRKLFRPAIFLLLLLPSFAFADDFPARSSTLVTDYTNTLNDGERQALEQKLVAFNDSTSTQIAIVILQSVGGYDISDYAVQLFNQWKIGQEKKNNGVLILVAIDDHKTHITTGHGIEGVLPDVVCKRIVEGDIIPNFKAGNFYAGLDQATSTIMSITTGEFTADDYKKHKVNQRIPWFPFVLFIFIFLIVIFSKVSRTRKYASTNHLGFWAAWALLNAATSRSQGSWGGFSGGGGWGGGSSGGGFGGFGGGSSGGGGAGGSW